MEDILALTTRDLVVNTIFIYIYIYLVFVWGAGVAQLVQRLGYGTGDRGSIIGRGNDDI